MSIFQVVIKGRYGTAIQLRNIRYFEFPGYTPNSTELQEFVDNLDDDLKDYLQGQFSTVTNVTGYDVRRVDLGEQPTLSLTPTAGAWVGINSGDPMPSQIAALVTWKSFTAYPRSSRNYLFPFSEASNSTGGGVSSGGLTQISGYANDSMTIQVTGQTSARAVAVEFGGDPRVVTASNILETVVTQVVWATQRRRRAGVGI